MSVALGADPIRKGPVSNVFNMTECYCYVDVCYYLMGTGLVTIIYMRNQTSSPGPRSIYANYTRQPRYSNLTSILLIPCPYELWKRQSSQSASYLYKTSKRSSETWKPSRFAATLDQRSIATAIYNVLPLLIASEE